MSSPSMIFEVDTSPNALAKFGFGKWGWRVFTRKANFILLLFVALIGFVVYLLVLDFINGSCTSDKTPIILKLLLITGLVALSSYGIYPHTQWRKVAPDASRFIGHNAVIAQQRGTFFKDTIPNTKNYTNATSKVSPELTNNIPNEQNHKDTQHETLMNTTKKEHEQQTQQTQHAQTNEAKLSTQLPIQPPVFPAFDNGLQGMILPKRASYHFDYV